MTDLKKTIEDLAAEFASNVIAAIRGVSIDELYALTAGGRSTARRPPSGDVLGGGGRRRSSERLGRRSAADIARVVDEIIGLLGKHQDGLRAEQIRAALNLQAKELPRPLTDALADGRIKKSGQKRATTYFLGDGGGASKKRAAKKKSR